MNKMEFNIHGRQNFITLVKIINEEKQTPAKISDLMELVAGGINLHSLNLPYADTISGIAYSGDDLGNKIKILPYSEHLAGITPGLLSAGGLMEIGEDDYRKLDAQEFKISCLLERGLGNPLRKEDMKSNIILGELAQGNNNLLSDFSEKIFKEVAYKNGVTANILGSQLNHRLPPLIKPVTMRLYIPDHMKVIEVGGINTQLREEYSIATFANLIKDYYRFMIALPIT